MNSHKVQADAYQIRRTPKRSSFGSTLITGMSSASA